MEVSAPGAWASELYVYPISRKVKRGGTTRKFVGWANISCIELYTLAAPG